MRSLVVVAGRYLVFMYQSEGPIERFHERVVKILTFGHAHATTGIPTALGCRYLFCLLRQQRHQVAYILQIL